MKLLTQLFNHAKERLLDSAYSCSEVVGDLFAGETFLVLHHKHEPLPGREFFEMTQNLLNHDVVEGRSVRA